MRTAKSDGISKLTKVFALPGEAAFKATEFTQA